MFLRHKYTPRKSLETIYYEGEQQEGESLEETMVRIAEVRRQHKEEKTKEYIESKAKYPRLTEVMK